jgi:hypothetical protein
MTVSATWDPRSPFPTTKATSGASSRRAAGPWATLREDTAELGCDFVAGVRKSAVT